MAALSTAVETDAKFFASIIHYVRRFREALALPSMDLTQGELRLLAHKIEEFYHQYRPTGEGLYIPPVQTANTDRTVQDINKLAMDVSRLSTPEFNSLLRKGLPAEQESAKSTRPLSVRPCVFIGHGRSKLWARVKVFLQDETGIATVTYESEPRSGEAIVPVLEKMLDQSSFAVLVLTAEDDLQDGARRARQNVVHEAGLFQGRLGFKRAILLVQEGIEEFSNVAGLQHIPFAADRIEQTFYELQRVLKRENQIA